jgi:hypothetical protein
LEYCNLGTAKRNPGPGRFDRGNVRHYRLCAPSRGAVMSAARPLFPQEQTFAGPHRTAVSCH